jgi:4-hydroxybenzoate polyprenyltransferase
MDLQIGPLPFAVLVLATVFMAAGGYAINDYFDRKPDRVNKPGSMVVGILIYPRHAMAYHLFFSIGGIIMGTWVSYKTGLLFLSIIFFMVSGLLWFYSTTYKKEFLLGNILVALLTAMVPFLVLLYELPLLARAYGSSITPVIRILFIWVLGFSLFAFLINLAREIIKDAEDIEGDRVYGKMTVPVVWGMKTTRWIVVMLLSMTIALLLTAWFFFIPDTITLVYFIVFFISPLLVAIIMNLRAGKPRSFHPVSTVLKAVMLFGLAYMIIVRFIIGNH